VGIIQARRCDWNLGGNRAGIASLGTEEALGKEGNQTTTEGEGESVSRSKRAKKIKAVEKESDKAERGKARGGKAAQLYTSRGKERDY